MFRKPVTVLRDTGIIKESVATNATVGEDNETDDEAVGTLVYAGRVALCTEWKQQGGQSEHKILPSFCIYI